MTTPLPGSGAQYPERIGPFRILGLLGRGATGVVFDAEGADGQRVALKVIRPIGDPDRARLTVARFLREAKILEQLDHPGVVGMIASGSYDGMLYLAMERIEGVSLLTVRRRGPLGLESTAQLGAHLADALHHLHAVGVVHRDIKPANILIDQRGRPVITDFGISGLSDATGITRQGDLLGSPGFMAPEVIEGATPDGRSDLFSLGRLLFELAALGEARRLPKNAPILQVLSIAMEIDWTRFPTGGAWPRLEAITKRLLANKPQDRYQDALRARDALAELLPHDVLDSDTLSEHVGKLGLQKSTSWEVLADDLGLGPQDPGDAIDPAAISDPFVSSPGLDPAPNPYVASPGSEANRVRSDTMRMPIAEIDDIESERTHRPGELPGLVARPIGGGTDDMGSEQDTQPPEGLMLPLPDKRLEPVSIPLASPRPPTSSPRVPTSSPRAPTANPREGTSNPGALFEAALRNDDDGQVPRLERQITRLKEELHNTKRQAQSGASRGAWIAVAFATVSLALAGGVWAGRSLSPSRPAVIVGSFTAPADPIVGPKNGRPATADERREALEMLEAGLEQMKAKNLDGALSRLRLCIEIADLADCHKHLGSILSLYGDPAGRAHLARYLELAPRAPDAEAIRKALDAP